MHPLTGTNPKLGVLMFQEFTLSPDGGESLSAHCRLTKRISEGGVTWEGKVNKTDCCVPSMSFSRKNQA